MEADAGRDLINKSKILNELHLKPRVIIGDDDSSTIDLVRRGNVETIFKLSDSDNYLNKNLGKSLFALEDKFKEIKKHGVISHLEKYFAYAIAANKKDNLKIATALKKISAHVFGEHDNCDEVWCRSAREDLT